jgi:hypothetical protein
MGLFVVLLWCAIFLRRYGGTNNSRFGEFNSRLSGENSRFGLQREFACNPLIWFSGFAHKWQFFRQNRRNSRYYGANATAAESQQCGTPATS